MFSKLTNSVLFILLLLFCDVPLKAEQLKVTGKPHIIDGDTIKILNIKIRLHGIDSPEIKQNCKDSDGILWRCGLDAKQALLDLVYSQIVTCIGSKRDRYKRLIAKCYVNELNIESFMVKNGWAIAYRKYSLDYVGEEKIAKNKKVGIWRGEFLDPSTWRKNYRKK